MKTFGISWNLLTLQDSLIEVMKKHPIQHNNSMFRGAPASSFKKAELLRRNMMPSELKLWEVLKNKFEGFKFRRQHPIHLFIVNFYCHKLKLVIELDGGYHNLEDQKALDIQRTNELENLGLHVIRFKSEEILNNLDSVLKAIADEITGINSNFE